MELYRDTLEIIHVIVMVGGMGLRGKRSSDDEQEDEDEEEETDSSK